MTHKQLNEAIDEKFYQLNSKAKNTSREQKMLRALSRLMYCIAEDHLLNLNQRVEALLLLKGYFISELNNRRTRVSTNEAIAFVWHNTKMFLGMPDLEKILQVRRHRVNFACKNYYENIAA